METRTTTLLDLPSETLNTELAKDNLDTRSVINVSLANTYTYQLFKPTLLQRLKKYIVQHANKQVGMLLNIHLDFDPSHLRDICQTALQVGNIDLCKVIVKGREDVLKQIELPKELVDEKNTYNFSAVVAAIESDQEEEVEAVLVQFRTDLDQIVKEKGFPFQALLTAHEIYNKKHRPWTEEQCNLFCIKIIGYLQRLSPAWLKKALATGIFHITERNEACNDTFILQQDINKKSNKKSIDPEQEVPNSGLGFDFCVNMGGFAMVDEDDVSLMAYADCHLKKYLNQKTAELGELMQRRSKLETKLEETSPCVIM